MTQSPIGQPRCYDDLLALLAGQMEKLGLGINQLDEICGFPAGYSAKVFGPSRTRQLSMGPRYNSLWLLCPELGVRITLIEDKTLLDKRRAPAKPYAKNQARVGHESQAPGTHVLRRVLRHIGRIGGKKRMAKMSNAEFKKHQTMASRARWVKPRRAANRKLNALGNTQNV